MKKIVLLLSVLLSSTVAFAQDLTILHLNDTHSNIEPLRGGEFKDMGGVIEQAAYIDSVRTADGKGNVLLLHAGDFSQGSPYFSEFKGDIEVDILNAMGFDAIALGNHEFDNGFEEIARRIKNIDAPVLCANYDFTGTPVEGLVKPYCTMTKGGQKIGIIGILVDLEGVTDISIYSAAKYQDPVAVVNKYADILKNKENCGLVVCLTHLGYYSDIDLAKSVRNVDVIVGGHSHTFVNDIKKEKDLDGKDVVIVTDGKWGVNVGKLSVSFQKNRLTELYNELKSQNVFSVEKDWFPYPSYNDRHTWAELLGAEADMLIKAGEQYIDYQWKNVDATSYLAFERTGERAIMENPLSANRSALASLMFAELAEGNGRFLDKIIDGAWCMSNMPSWVLSAHLPRQKTKRSLPDPDQQIIDLGSGSAGAQLAVVYHFFHDEFDEVDPVISRVVKAAIKKQILDPYLNPDVQGPNWWLGYDITSNNVINNWNPWCNADVILCYLLVEDDQQLLDRALYQSAKSVDKFLAYIKTDGACEEGPAYWGHAAGKLYDYLQIMYDASEGKFSIYDDPQIRKMGEYISRSFVCDGWVINFADASARMGYAPSLIYNYGKAVGSDEMMNFALYNLSDAKTSRFVAPKVHINKDAYRTLENIRTLAEISSKVAELNESIDSGKQLGDCLADLRQAVPGFTWYPETEFCYMINRSNWFLAAKGGHNNESHNHNDIGTFILYVDGIPMFVDAGVGTYTKKTFSSERYTIWSMCSDYHNLPVINGITQKFGGMFRSGNASAADGRSVKKFSLNIEGAYPEQAGCISWKREYQLKDKSLDIVDTYSLSSRNEADVENFLFQGDVYLPGMKVDGYIVSAGEVVIVNKGVRMRLKYPKSLTPSVLAVELDDPRFTNVWGNKLYRLSLTSDEKAPVKGKYTFNISQF